ncbi:MAG: DUF4440 domain-containing protein [Rhodothermales bacterium]|nr:DUF4440 domain-containing protein [Rhodothermales bacterium]
MRSTILSITTAFVLTFVSVANAQDPDLTAIYKNIKAFSQAYMDADYELLASFYTEDGMILPPGTDIIVGREAIEKRWTLPAEIKTLHHAVKPERIEIVGDHAWDVGYYKGKTRNRDGSESEWGGKYLIVWQKVDGQWLILADAWNRTN